MAPTLGNLVRRSLVYFAKSHLAVGAGVAAATAVIVGALVVGDSVRGSLRGLVVDRLGNLQCVLQSRTYFRTAMLDSVRQADSTGSARIVPAIILPSATIETRRDERLSRASQVQVLGVDAEFWDAASNKPLSDSKVELGEDQVALNAGLASELGIAVGDELTVRFEKNSGVPADNPLGRRDDAAINLPRQKVVALLPDDSIGGLNLRAGQAMPKNVFVSLSSLQSALEIEDSVNAAWVIGSSTVTLDAAYCDRLNKQLHPSLEDFGLQLDHHVRQFPDPKIDLPTEESAAPKEVYDYYQLSSKDLILEDGIADAAKSASGLKAQRVMAYLANAIYRVDSEGKADLASEVPYSIVAGLEPGGSLELPIDEAVQKRSADEKLCWVNSWLADQLQLKLEIEYS